jgi:hypothetical protein
MNKSVIYMLAVLSAITIQASQPHNRATGPISTGGSSATLATANYTHTISPSQINNTGRYTVKESGYYFLTDDLHFYPQRFTDNASNSTSVLGTAGTDSAAIYISADNVVLDLNNKSISMNSSRSPLDYINAAGVNAIIVKEGAQNVTIKNGTIAYSTGCGIEIRDGSIDGATNNITISNMNIMNCPNGGIVAGGINNKNIHNVSINNINISKCRGTIAYGANGSYSYTGNGNARGIVLNKVLQGNISNCSCSNNYINTDSTITKSDNTSDATGLYLIGCQNIEIISSSFNNNNAYQSYGMHLQTCNNIQVSDCKMIYNHIILRDDAGASTPVPAAEATATAAAAGIRINASTFCRFDNCEASKNSLEGTALTLYGAGFFIDGRTNPSNYNEFVNCHAYGNAGGGAIGTATKTDEDSNTIYDIGVANAGAIGAGFLSIGKDGDANMNTGNQYLKCTAKGNTCVQNPTSPTHGETNAIGICLLHSDAAVVEDCICIANGSFSTPYTRGVGLLLGPIGSNNTTKPDKTAALTRNAMVRNCWFIANTSHGLYDMAADCQSLFMENYAFRNGVLNGAYAEGNAVDINNSNFRVDYEQSNENLPLASGTVGGFGAFNVAGKFVNYEIQVTADSLYHGDTGYPYVPSEDS